MKGAPTFEGALHLNLNGMSRAVAEMDGGYVVDFECLIGISKGDCGNAIGIRRRDRDVAVISVATKIDSVVAGTTVNCVTAQASNDEYVVSSATEERIVSTSGKYRVRRAKSAVEQLVGSGTSK
jgi:hypothetical protein